MIRLIDVERFCLVDIKDMEVPWVALSYVWGLRPFRTLVQADLEEFMKPGSLVAPWVPNTIADAMTVTRELGERYLWTDSLCIIQDSYPDKLQFIPNMDLIYGLASLTIVNGGGKDAFCGLPGVRPSTRFQDELPVQVGDGWISLGLSCLLGGENLIVDGFSWYTRGWTYQEMVLSRRLLIFMPEQVHWECQQATWREDGCWELPHHGERGQTICYQSALYQNNFGFQLSDMWTASPTAARFDSTYQNLVHAYSRRVLTRDSDGLAAFEGILHALTQVFGVDFVWGLPKPFLGVAITWCCDPDGSRRRISSTKLSLGSGDNDETIIVDAVLPSWSWAGWSCQVYYAELFGYLDSEHAGLEFYVITPVGEMGDKVVHVPQNTEFRRFNDARAPFDKDPVWWRGDTTIPVYLQDIPPELLKPETKYSLLMFWTSCVEVELNPEDMGISIGGRQPRHLSWGWTQRPTVMTSRIELIIVGRSSLETSHSARLVALSVARHRSGAMTREGQLEIEEQEWNKLPGRKWELVFLL